jgi:YidC/Oxa1 family membrane protein insertase
MLWQAWQVDYGPKPELAATEQIAEDIREDVPVATMAEDGSASTIDNSQELIAVPLIDSSSSGIITVTTDVFNLEIDPKGGTLRNLDLIKYPKSSAQANEGWVQLLKEKFDINWLPKPKVVDEEELIRLFNGDQEKLFLAQSGLIGSNSAAPNHHAIYRSAKNNYVLAPEQNTLKVPLIWTNDQGIEVTKTFIFTRDSYLIDLYQEISNQSSKVWTGRQYTQLLRKPYEDGDNKTFIRTYTGGVIYTEAEKYEKIDYDDMADTNLNVKAIGGWSAMIQHYFASAWVPPQDQENTYYTKTLKKTEQDWHYVIGSYSQLQTVEPYQQHSFKSQLFSGPKLQPVMEKIAKGLELTVDYGFLTFIGKPIFWLLNKLYSLVGNWGVAIMGVTLIIKAMFFPLSNASYRSMAKMRKVQPRLQHLKEQHGDDKQAFNTEMMAMYKKEKVNPMGGCVPILIQIPVFISLYWVLIETVELRQAPFAMWIIDLSIQDPYFVLPVLMGITMKLQQMLNPPPLDPIQAKVIKMFPIIFTVFFLFFPSGLVLYWVCNNTLSFLQQWYITRSIEREDAARA